MSEKASGGGGAKNMILFGGIGLILLLGAIGATLYFIGFFGGKAADSHGGGGHGSPAHATADFSLPPIYQEIRPAFVVNTIDANRMHFLQVAITVMSRNNDAIAAVNTNLFLLQNDIREVLSGRPHAELLNNVGIEALRAEVEAAAKKCLESRHLPSIDALYFTSFVIQ